MNLQPVLIRERIIRSIRTFFLTKEFHEIVTPTLQYSLPLEPNIYALKTSWKTVRRKKTLFLTTSPEASLKKMIAAGIGNCYAIAKSFRNLEDASLQHIPEFMMLEWYREHATYLDIMNDVEQLIHQINAELNHPLNGTVVYQNKKMKINSPWKRYSMFDLFAQYAGLNLEKILDDKPMIAAAKEKGYEVRIANWEQLFNQIFLNEIEPELGFDPCFIIDFPTKISPLCAPKKNNPLFAERFELYLGGMELANGNTENTDTKSIQTSWHQEKQDRRKKHIAVPAEDNAFLDALEKMHTASHAGIGLGIDRLAMIFADSKNIMDVEPLVVT